jgi:hypothetical protein
MLSGLHLTLANLLGQPLGHLATPTPHLSNQRPPSRRGRPSCISAVNVAKGPAMSAPACWITRAAFLTEASMVPAAGSRGVWLQQKSTGSTTTGTTRKPKPQDQNRNDQQPHNHQQVQKAGAKIIQGHITITNIHKQRQDNALIKITILNGGAASAMSNGNPTSPHKKAADVVLKAGVGLA